MASPRTEIRTEIRIERRDADGHPQGVIYHDGVAVGLLTFSRGTPPPPVLRGMADAFGAAYTLRGNAVACAAIGADPMPLDRRPR